VLCRHLGRVGRNQSFSLDARPGREGGAVTSKARPMRLLS